MSATNPHIIVWGTANKTGSGGSAPRRSTLLRERDSLENLRKRYSELTSLAARLVEECRRLRGDNDDLRDSAEIWIRMYERQLERANVLEAESRRKPLTQ